MHMQDFISVAVNETFSNLLLMKANCGYQKSGETLIKISRIILKHITNIGKINIKGLTEEIYLQ